MCIIPRHTPNCIVCGKGGQGVEGRRQDCGAKDKTNCALTYDINVDDITCADCAQQKADEEEPGYMYASGKY